MQPTDAQARHWAANLRLTAVLLGIWFVVSFVLIFFARDLNFSFFGWPFSFWVAAQGALLVYGFITWFYARRMSRLDDRLGTESESESDPEP